MSWYINYPCFLYGVYIISEMHMLLDAKAANDFTVERKLLYFDSDFIEKSVQLRIIQLGAILITIVGYLY